MFLGLDDQSSVLSRRVGLLRRFQMDRLRYTSTIRYLASEVSRSNDGFRMMNESWLARPLSVMSVRS
jgi:hypothetical protein